jgi:hypothetical protein
MPTFLMECRPLIRPTTRALDQFLQLSDHDL